MKIPVRLLNGQVLPIVTKEGDWIDIATTSELNLQGPTADTLKRSRAGKQDVSIRAVNFHPETISLNMAMELPAGFEAVVLPRSSTFNKYGLDLGNTEGVIDQRYCGNTDIWRATIKPYRTVTVPAKTRLFQFRIQLSQKATVLQKLRWLFWNGKIEFVEVDKLDNPDRKGFGEGTQYLDNGPDKLA